MSEFGDVNHHGQKRNELDDAPSHRWPRLLIGLLENMTRA